MRIAAAPDGLTERIGLLFNQLPTPIGEAMFAMPVARSLQVAQRTGMLAALAEGPREPAELAEHLGLQAAGTELVLDVIASLGHLELRPDGRYEMTSRARRWLDPPRPLPRRLPRRHRRVLAVVAGARGSGPRRHPRRAA